MGPPQLDNLAEIGNLRTDAAAKNEFQSLNRFGIRRLDKAKREKLSLESRFDVTCSEVHTLALTDLQFHGYRSDSRHLVFQRLQHTLDLRTERRGVLAQANRQHGQRVVLQEYERVETGAARAAGCWRGEAPHSCS